MSKRMTYKTAGVDIHQANVFVNSIQELMKLTINVNDVLCTGARILENGINYAKENLLYLIVVFLFWFGISLGYADEPQNAQNATANIDKILTLSFRTNRIDFKIGDVIHPILDLKNISDQDVWVMDQDPSLYRPEIRNYKTGVQENLHERDVSLFRSISKTRKLAPGETITLNAPEINIVSVISDQNRNEWIPKPGQYELSYSGIFTISFSSEHPGPATKMDWSGVIHSQSVLIDIASNALSIEKFLRLTVGTLAVETEKTQYKTGDIMNFFLFLKNISSQDIWVLVHEPLFLEPTAIDSQGQRNSLHSVLPRDYLSVPKIYKMTPGEAIGFEPNNPLLIGDFSGPNTQAAIFWKPQPGKYFFQYALPFQMSLTPIDEVKSIAELRQRKFDWDGKMPSELCEINIRKEK